MTFEAESKMANSLGHQLSHSAQLDGHYALCQAEYDAMARAIGIEPGWHVLDAGCGTGTYLPLLSELVSNHGAVTAIDIAPDNIEKSEKLTNELGLRDIVSVQKGAITDLPFEDETFDATWCANVSQYLSDDEFDLALSEMIRVVKPGGTIAIKEFDLTSWLYQPLDPWLLPRLFEGVAERFSIQAHGCLRPLRFHSLLQDAGLEGVWLKGYSSETYPPLRPNDKEYIGSLLQWLADLAADSDLSAHDQATWRRIRDVDSADHILNRSDFYAREIHLLAVGKRKLR